jgi:hypothetical protein
LSTLSTKKGPTEAGPAVQSSTTRILCGQSAVCGAPSVARAVGVANLSAFKDCRPVIIAELSRFKLIEQLGWQQAETLA